MSSLKYRGLNDWKPILINPSCPILMGCIPKCCFHPLGLIVSPDFKSKQNLCHGHIIHVRPVSMSSMSPRWSGPPRE